MPIIDNARGAMPPAPDQARGPGPVALEQPPTKPPGAEPSGGGAAPSEQAKDVILACLGMLYDDRIGMGRKIAEQIRRSRDPAGIIANSAHDIVASAIEKTGLALAPEEFKRVAGMIVAKLAELATAMSVPLSEEDAAAAAEMLRERAGEGQSEPAEQQAPQPQEQVQ